MPTSTTDEALTLRPIAAQDAANHRTPLQPVVPSKLFSIDCLLEYQLAGPAEFIFQVHALQGMGQRVVEEFVELNPAAVMHVYADPHLKQRFLRVSADAGPLSLHYRATVQRNYEAPMLQALEQPIAQLPDDILHNLLPTRYCESDLLGRAARKMFGGLAPGRERVQHIADWIYDNVEYERGSTETTTTAADVFRNRAGVCRDFAHLGTTFCRALNIPARLVVGYAGLDDGEPDFHAVFEAWLGKRWEMFDATRLCDVDEMVRIASGRDAKDVAFATIYGPASMMAMRPTILRLA